MQDVRENSPEHSSSSSRSTLSSSPAPSAVEIKGDVVFASAEEQEQRTIELLGEGALVITLPPPTIDLRGRLGEVLEELVERELARVGAPSPYLAAWSAMPEDAEARLADQLFRTRSTGGTGLVIACGSLRSIAIPTLTPDDSAVLRWLAVATDASPLILMLDDADLQVLGHRSAIPLSRLLGRPLRLTPVPPSPLPVFIEEAATTNDTRVAESPSIDLAEAVAIETTANSSRNPEEIRESKPTFVDTEKQALDLDLERMDVNDEVPTVDAVKRELTPPAVAVAVTVAVVAEPVSAASPPPPVDTEKEVAMPEPTPSIDIVIEDVVVELKAAEPEPMPISAPQEIEPPPPSPLPPQVVVAEAVSEPEVPVVLAPPPPPVVVKPKMVEEAPMPATTITPPKPERRTRGTTSGASRRVTAGVPVVGPNDAWRTWAISLSAAKGAQPLNAFERLFAESYVPLAAAIAKGLDDPRAIRAYDDFRRTFEHSYTDAFATFGATNRRPRLVMDAYDIATKQARLANARSTQVLCVDSMRLDIGCLIRDAITRETAGMATLVSETLLWSALPTTTMRQLETFARGLDALRAPVRERDSEPTESLRGRAAEVVRRIRIGSRELWKLDFIPAMLEGRDSIASFPDIAEGAAEAIARHFSLLTQRTLVLVVGDHGFSIDRRGEIMTGGASPEEVLVPAFAFFVGELH